MTVDKLKKRDRSRIRRRRNTRLRTHAGRLMDCIIGGDRAGADRVRAWYMRTRCRPSIYADDL